MDNNDLKQALLQAFSEEAPEILQKTETALLDIESAAEADEHLYANQLKRALHSLKGSASAIGRSDIRNVCHALEELLLEEGEKSAAAAKLDKFHSGLAFLRDAIANPAVLQEDAAHAIVQMIQAESNAHPSPEKATTEAASSANKAIVAAMEPQLAPPPVDKAIPADDDSLSDKVPAKVLSATTNRATDNVINETIRVSVDKIEAIQSGVGELVSIRLQQQDELSKLLYIQNDVSLLQNDWQQIKSIINDYCSLLPKSALSKLDTRLSSFNAKVKTTQRDIFHLTNHARNQAGNLALLSDQFDSGLRAIRMMPLGPFFESYRASARDAARALGKSVQVSYDDKDVEVDRLVLEKIKEPILHLIRNAVAHGIEMPEQRNALSKNESGSIKLSAYLNGDYVYIQIKDDGAGFNRSKIKEKAVKSNLMHSDEELSDSLLLELVCRPGFSTAAQTDMISGRGIGMDVVFTLLTEMGGTIELETHEGMGSCFTLRIPSSLAKTQGLILQVGQKCFGLALDMVDRIVRAKLDSLSSIEGKQVLYVDDEPVAVSSLAAIFNLPQYEPRHSKVPYPIVIIRSGNRRIALIVDDVPGEIPLVIKSLGPQFEHMAIYSGGSILSDGAILPIVNARQLVSMVSSSQALKMDVLDEDDNTDSPVDVIAQERGIIVVVDDSITTRTLERNILEAAGYNVAVATDGIEALDLLMTEDNVSLVVTDLEMPRMNGLELCKKIRSGRNADLPIIMVTSLGNEAEMKKGLEAGADAYIVKSDFQQDYFLDMVERFAR